jgi:hypothetical protein
MLISNETISKSFISKIFHRTGISKVSFWKNITVILNLISRAGASKKLLGTYFSVFYGQSRMRRLRSCLMMKDMKIDVGNFRKQHINYAKEYIYEL